MSIFLVEYNNENCGVLQKDVWSIIIRKYSSLKEVDTLSKVSKFFNNLISEQETWKSLFLRDFGFLPERISDMKFKYVVAYNYKLGSETVFLDRAKSYHQKVVSLLKDCKQREHWMNYYLGSIYLYGSDGNYNNVEHGVRILKEISDYYPALKELINFQFNGCPLYNPDKRKSLNKFIEESIRKPQWETDGKVLRDRGIMYSKGILYAKNLYAAIKFLNEAVNQKCVDAYVDLGHVYKEKKENQSAVSAFTNAFNNGVISGAHALGDFYDGQHDKDQAVKWYLAAYEKDDLEAGVKVGMIYYKTKNNNAVKTWFTDLYNKGSAKAAFFLGSLDQKEEKMDSAMQWFMEGVKKGNDLSAITLGNLHSNSQTPNLFDLNKALDYYILAYQLGNKKSILKICSIYLDNFKLLAQSKIAKCVYWFHHGRSFDEIDRRMYEVEKFSEGCRIAIGLTKVIREIQNHRFDAAELLFDLYSKQDASFVSEISPAMLDIENLSVVERRKLTQILPIVENKEGDSPSSLLCS